MSYRSRELAQETDEAKARRLEHEQDVEPNLEAARQVIDILEMLQAKTRGNLDESERAMLESSLHDLHMRFVQAKSKS